MNKELIQEAITLYGKDIVYEVVSIVSVSDADGAYVLFEDMGQYDHASCVEMLYFEAE